MYESERRSRDYYEGRARWYDWANRIAALLRGESATNEPRKAIRLLNLKPGQRVLEVSVGTGTNLPLLAEQVGPMGASSARISPPPCLDAAARSCGGKDSVPISQRERPRICPSPIKPSTPFSTTAESPSSGTSEGPSKRWFASPDPAPRSSSAMPAYRRTGS